MEKLINDAEGGDEKLYGQVVAQLPMLLSLLLQLDETLGIKWKTSGQAAGVDMVCGMAKRAGQGQGLANGDSLSVDSVTVNCMQKLPLDGVKRCAAQN